MQPNDSTSIDTTTQNPSSGSNTPLVEFDTGGRAAVISYDVPEAISYEGLHVLTIDDYGLQDFADVITSTTPGPAPNVTTQVTPATVTAPPLTDSVAAPRAIVLSDSSTPTNAVIALAPFDTSQRLTRLTWADVETVAAGGKRVEIYRSVGGMLDYRVRAVPPAGPSQAPPVPRFRPLMRAGGPPPPPPRDPTDPNPFISVVVTNPPPGNPVVTGSSGGYTLTASGVVGSRRAGVVSVEITLLDASGATKATVPATVSGQTWSGTVSITESGSYRVSVRATGNATDVVGTATAPITVQIPPAQGPPQQPATAPALTIETPTPNAVIIEPDGRAIVTVSGTADTLGGSAVSVTVHGDSSDTPSQAVLTAVQGTTSSTFTTTVEVDGQGSHQILVTCTNTDGISAPAVTIPVRIAASQPLRPVDRRLILMEKLAITSFLGRFGASRVVKTFTLLPGESTTISVDSYQKEESTAKAAQAIVDSTASECAADLEDTINAENDTKITNTDAVSKSISADIGAGWGWGHADVKGGYSDQTNASRDQASKTVSNALTKHTTKASSNRTVNVNTDFSITTSGGNTTDTSRTLKNINVSRVLNFVFRQMTQEYVVLTHLVDVTLGFYRSDVLLDGSGQPMTGPDGGPLVQESFVAITMPEVAQFARTELTGAAADSLQADLLAVLSNIVDIAGAKRALVELVTPDDPTGAPLPDASYLRVVPGLSSGYPATGTPDFTVPGILLDVTRCVMRTDQLLCDALLGDGDGLDAYSHALQDVAIAERQAAADERSLANAREKLAQQIISTQDADMAAIWQKVFPPPLSVPATITVPATADRNGAAPDPTPAS